MLRLVTAPTALPITVSQVKEILGINGDDQDPVVNRALRSAVEYVQDHVSLVLSPAVYRVERDSWWEHPGDLAVLVAPVRSVTELSYLNEDEDSVVIAESNYRWHRAPEGAIIRFNKDFSLPVLAENRMDAVQIVVSVGFDDPTAETHADPELLLPDRIVQAISMVAGHYFEHREAVQSEPTHKVEMSVGSILGQLRVFR